jgi:hypothetical protein
MIVVSVLAVFVDVTIPTSTIVKTVLPTTMALSLHLDRFALQTQRITTVLGQELVTLMELPASARMNLTDIPPRSVNIGI